MALKFKVAYAPNHTLVRLTGPIDEHVLSALDDLKPQLRSNRVIFDCEGISFINSIGAANWIAYLGDCAGFDVSFIKCPPAFTNLCLILPDIKGSGRIDSVFVHYYCPGCEEELDAQLVNRVELTASGFPPRQCPQCRSPMALDPEDEDFGDLMRVSA